MYPNSRRSVPGGRHRVNRIARQFLILFLLVLGIARSLPAQPWPSDVDRRLELRCPERLPAGDSLYGKLGDLERLRLIVPENVVVFDDSGKVVVSKVIVGRSGRHELWFQAERKHKYFVGWETVIKVSPPAKTEPIANGPDPKEQPAGKIKEQQSNQPPKKRSDSAPTSQGGTKGKPKAAAVTTRSARPPGWASAVPVVDVHPGEMFSKPTWEIKQEAAFNTGRRAQDFLVSREQFRDFELTLRIRPETAGQVGVSVRIGNVNSPRRSGLCWLVGVSTAAGQTQGINRTLGLVRENEEGPVLKLQDWNDLKVSCQGQTVQLSLNGELCKSLQLPGGSDPAGAIALVSDSTSVRFDDVKITELPSQKVLLAENFSSSSDAAGEGGGLADHWRLQGLGAASGFMRVINTGTAATRFEAAAHVHHAPWRIGPVSLGKSLVESQQSSPWLWIESLEDVTAPFTLKINVPGPGLAKGLPKMKATDRPVEVGAGTVEFVRSLAGREGDYIRRFRLQSEPVVVEVGRLDFRDEADLRTPEEIGDELLELVRKLKFPGKRPEKLPSGSPSGTAADLEAGRLLGFNAVSGSPQGFPADAFRKLGYQYIFSDSHALETREQGFGFKTAVVEAEMKKLADDWKKLGLADKVFLLNLFEDAALEIEGQVRKAQPVNLAIDPSAWKQMMAVAGLKPADFIVADNPPPASAAPDSPEYWEKLQAVHPNSGRKDPAGALNSLRLLASIWPTRFRNGTEAARRAFHRGVLTTVDIHPEQYFLQGLGGIDPWTVFSRQQSLDVAMSRDDSALDPLEEEYLIDLQRSAQGSSQKPVFGSFAAQSGHHGRSSQSLEMRGMSALGAGARGLIFSAWGPRWQADSKWYSDDTSRLQTIGQVNHAAGWVEDIILDGRPAQGEVGILVSPLSDLWEFMLRDRERLDVLAERRRLHRLFRSMYYQVDFLNDEQLPRDSEMDRYRVLVISQPCMTAATARRLEAWVIRGGTLIGSASIGQLDENCRSTAVEASKEKPVADGLLSAFGIKSLAWRRSSRRQVAATPAATLEVAEPIRKIEVDSAEVIHKFNTGDSAVTRRKLGKGQFIFCGFALGAVYHGGAHLEQEVFKGMQASVRELVRPWLAGVGPPLCRTDHPLISARLIRSYYGNALFLINSSGAPVSRVRVAVRISGVQSAESLSQGKLNVVRDGSNSQFELPLKQTDIVRFK